MLMAQSPLVLSDRLITLAREADRAGCVAEAGDLVRLAHSVLDRPQWSARHASRPAGSSVAPG